MTGKNTHLPDRHGKPHGNDRANALVCAIPLSWLPYRDGEYPVFLFDAFALRTWRDEHFYIHAVYPRGQCFAYCSRK